MDISGRNAAEHFVICIENQGYPASLEKRKVYQEVPDPDAAKQDLIRSSMSPARIISSLVSCSFQSS